MRKWLFVSMLIFPLSALGQTLDRTHINYYNPLIHGSGCNSTTLNAAISSIGSSDATTLMMTATDRARAGCVWTPTAAVTVPDNITLWFPPGSKLNCNGQTISIAGQIAAGDDQIFTNCAIGLSITGPTPINPMWFGAVGDASTDNGAAIRSAIAAAPSNGGHIKFPRGEFNIHSALGTCSAKAFLTLEGEGARWISDTLDSPTRIIYTATGTTTALTVSGNGCRGFTLRNIELAYSSASFTGDLLTITGTAGFLCDHCALGGDRSASPVLVAAQSVVSIDSTENPVFEHCMIQQAQRGIYVPTIGATTMSGLAVNECWVGNASRAAFEQEAAGGFNTKLTNNIFDFTSSPGTSPTYGVIVRSNGFTITGNMFSASTANDTPTTYYVDLNGTGTFSGNSMNSNKPGINLNTGGIYSIIGNYINAKPPLTVVGGHVMTRANTFNVTNIGTVGVSITPAGAATTSLDMGPDYFGNSFTGFSYAVSTNDPIIQGVIRFNPAFDNSSLGPGTESPHVALENQTFRTYTDSTSTGNVGAGEDVLGSIVLPANALAVNGHGLKIEAWGITADNTNNKTVRVLCGNHVIVDTTATAVQNKSWRLEGTLLRLTSATAESIGWGSWNAAILPSQRGAGTDDWTTSITCSVLGTSAASATDDVIKRGFVVEMVP